MRLVAFLFLIFQLLPVTVVAQPTEPKSQTKNVPRKFNLFQNDFRLIDSLGRAHTLTQFIDSDFLFLISYAQGRTASANLYKDFSEFFKADSKAAVLWINAGLPQDRKLVNQEIQGSDGAPVLMDFSQTVSKSLNFQSVGDVVVLSPKTWSILYEGHILDPEFSEFLVQSKISKAVPYLGWKRLKWKWTTGTELNYETFDFSKETARIQHLTLNYCVQCHSLSPGLNYFKSISDFQSRAAMNRKTMRLYDMPAGGIDYDDESLCQTRFLGKVKGDDLSFLMNWFEQGAPYSSDSQDTSYYQQELAKLREKQSAYKTPDLVWMPGKTNRIPAEGPAYFAYNQVAGPLSEDLYVGAVRIVTNADVTHHMDVFISEKPLDEIFKLKDDGRSLSEHFVNVNGKRRRQYRYLDAFSRFGGLKVAVPGAAWKIPKGSYVFTRSHYAPTGRVESAKNYVEIFKSQLDPQKIKLQYRVTLPTWQFTELKPNESNVVVSGDYPVVRPLNLIHASAHMHNRGISYRFWLVSPDKKQKKLICNVPHYQLKGELNDGLPEPMELPLGSQVHFEIEYDNSNRNIANPDPSALVKRGKKIDTEEMADSRLILFER